MKVKNVDLFLVIMLTTSVFWVGIYGQTTTTLVVGTTVNPNISNSENTSNYTNVILLGWDGVQREHLFELINRGLMPNLSAFVQTGKLFNVTVSDHYTDTKAGWTQILTGYRWWKTGIFQNSNWFHAIPRGYTIPERLENIYGSTQIATAFITGKLNQMEIEDGTGTAAVGSPFSVYSNEALYDNLPSQLDFVSVGDLAEDRYANVTGPLMLQFIQNNTNNRFFGFFHLSDPDHIGHMYGENSIQYENAIETCDYWLGQILNKLNTLGLSQKTLIYVTADHGFDEDATTHQNAPYIFLATNDNNVSRNGDQVDIAPTVYYGLGLWNYSFSPALDGFPMQVNLTETEIQHRQATLADTTSLLTPSISISDNGLGQKTLTFNATDNNLAAVLLLIDNRLRTDVSLTWNNTGSITASGSYNINTTILNQGLHTVKILAFDEHGANNGGSDKPSIGGWPSINSINFYVGTPPTPSPTPFSTNSTLPTSSPSPSPSPKPSSSATPTTISTQTPIPTIPTSTNPPETGAQLPIVLFIPIGIVAAFAIIGILVFFVKRRKH